MTAPATDGAPVPPLGFQEDDPVWGVAHVVRGLEGGLRKAVEVDDPVAYRRGAPIVFVVEAVVDEIAFTPSEGPGGLPGVTRQHTSKLALLAVVDRPVVAKILDEQRRKLDELANRKALFDSSGNPTEPLDDDQDDQDLSEAEKKVRNMFGKDGDKRGPRRGG
jgi:hypothetical protein